MILVVALSVMIFTTTISVLSGLNNAPAAFSGDEEFVISDVSAPTIFSSQLDESMVDALQNLQSVTAASPEILAFSSWDGRSFVVRGVGAGSGGIGWPSADRIEIAGNEEYVAGNDTLIGSRLLDRLGLTLPYTIPLVGSYSSKAEFVRVVGSFHTGDSLDDELLVPLDVAGHLSGMAQGKVSIIRVATTDPEWLSRLLSPKHARFALFDLHLSETEVVLGDAIDVEVKVLNWGLASGDTTVRFFVNETQFAEVNVILNGTSSTLIRERFVSQYLFSGKHRIIAAIVGDFPMALSAEFESVEAYVHVEAPSRVLLGSDFEVKVTRHTGEPASGAIVDFEGQHKICDSNGSTTLRALETGSFYVIANYPDTWGGSAPVEIVDPSMFPDEFNPIVTSFFVSPFTIHETETAKGTLTVENNGTLPGSAEIVVYADSAPYLTLNVTLDGMSFQTLTFDIGDLDPGTHVVQAGTFSVELSVQPWFAESSDLVRLVVRYGGSSSLSSASGIPIYQAAKISEGNVAVALFAIGAISALLAILAVTSIFSKEIHEGRRRLGVLKTIGASRADVRRLVFPQALESSLAGAAIGVGLGVSMSDWLSKAGVFFVFGHELSLELDAGLVIFILLGAVLISVLSALASAYIAGQEAAIRSIRRLEEEPGEKIDVNKIIGDE